MALQTKLAFFAVCFAVFVMVEVSMADGMAMTPDQTMYAPVPAPSGSPNSLTYSSMVTGLLAFIVTFLVVWKGV